MSKYEDFVPPTYPYAWSKASDLPLQDFLSKYKPSMVQNDGTKPWLWVKASEAARQDEGIGEAVEEASKLLKDVTTRVESIKNDASIPIRSNKKTGAKSKKEVREQVHSEATEQLREISTRHGYVSGKWLILAAANKVDMIWSNLATSLVSGPLASTSAFLAKVATSPETESPNYQHLICVYLPDVYDKDGVIAVMEVLLRNHGVSLTGVKSDLYTAIGIDSKHASGIPSTIWKNSALMTDTEMKALKEAFFSDKAVPTEPSQGAKKPPDPSKTRQKLKKKVEDDPFASDTDGDQEEEKRKQTIKTKKAGAKAKRAQPSSDGDERPKKKRVGEF